MPQQEEDIIGSAPNWLIRWGSVLCCAILVLILSLGFILKVPKTVRAGNKTIKIGSESLFNKLFHK